MVTKKILERFIALAVNTLSGDWILLGGMVLPLIHSKTRPTYDIDLAPKKNSANAERLKLMELAERVGLPPEAINLAAEHFLKKIGHWEKHLVLVREGKKGKIYRPDATLFLLLKIERLSESDLHDCLEMVKAAKKSGESLEKRVRHRIDQLLKTENPEKTNRLIRLKDTISSIKGESSQI